MKLERMDRAKTSRAVLSERLFLGLFAALLIVHCICNTSLLYAGVPWMNGVFLLKKLLSIAMLAKVLLFSTRRAEEWIGLGVILLLGCASFLASGSLGLFELFLVAAGADRTSPGKIVACFAAIKGAAIVLTLAAWRIGLLPDLVYANGSKQPYQTYGFCHRNVLAANIAVFCLAWLFLRYEKLNLADVLLSAAAALTAYGLASSRTGAVMVLLIGAGMYLCRRLEPLLRRAWWLPFAAVGIFLLFTALSLWCMLCYDKGSAFWTFLDSLFTTRVRSANFCYTEFGLSLFGQDIPFVSSIEAQAGQNTKLILDNAYCRALLYYGLLPGAMFLLVYGWAVASTARNGHLALMAGLLLMAVFGLSERYMMEAYYQLPFVLTFQTLFLCPPRLAERLQRLKRGAGNHAAGKNRHAFHSQ